MEDLQLLQAELRRREDIIRSLTKQVRGSMAEGALFQELAEVVECQPPITKFVTKLPTVSAVGKTCEAVGMLLSDLHGDEEVTPEKVMGYEDFNFDEFCRRAQRLVDVTTSFCFENMSNYSFDELHIFGLGDYVSGEIHDSTDHSKWHNALKNAMGVGDVIALMINDLSRKFKKIHLYSVSGNHGRRTIRKDYRGAHDNWDYLVAKWVEARCSNLISAQRLVVEIPDSFSHLVTIKGHTFFLNHGDDMMSLLGTPYYAIDRSTRNIQSIANIKNQKIDYFLFGHWHKAAMSQITTGEWIVNGSFKATDSYLLHSKGGYAEPKQKIFGIHQHYGKSWEIAVALRGYGKNVPQRYRVII